MHARSKIHPSEQNPKNEQNRKNNVLISFFPLVEFKIENDSQKIK